MNLTIADRRALADKAARSARFRNKLASDPLAAIKEATGRAPFETLAVKIVEEDAAWCFVLPGSGDIEATLPVPADDRTAIENDVYALVRDKPALRQQAVRDPKRFLRDYFGVDLGHTAVELLQEEPGTAIIVMPNPALQGEMPDELLDLVAGGGQSGCMAGTAEQIKRDGST